LGQGCRLTLWSNISSQDEKKFRLGSCWKNKIICGFDCSVIGIVGACLRSCLGDNLAEKDRLAVAKFKVLEKIVCVVKLYWGPCEILVACRLTLMSAICPRLSLMFAISDGLLLCP
jgi:hypothetical protein